MRTVGFKLDALGQASWTADATLDIVGVSATANGSLSRDKNATAAAPVVGSGESNIISLWTSGGGGVLQQNIPPVRIFPGEVIFLNLGQAGSAVIYLAEVIE